MRRTADEVILDRVFDEYGAAEYPGMPEADVFERFAVSQVLKPRDLTPDEIDDGIVDGNMDGGIDSVFVFLNGALVRPDDPVLDPASTAVRALSARPELDVFLIQAKNSSAWQEVVWEHLLSTLPAILDLEADDAALQARFNASLIERTGVIRRALTSLATKFPRVSFRVSYVCRAPERNLSEPIKAKAEQVREVLAGALTGGAVVTVKHVGVTELYKLASSTYGEPAQLRFRNLLREADSFVGVVSLDDYLAFIRDDAGNLREELFDANVRDYEGDNRVNESIGMTLSANDGVEFWWQNNGVTVLGDEVDSPQQTLTISKPLIVNGLQTSHVLHRSDIDGNLAAERRSDGIVVRVIQSTDEDVRDRIIAGTNRQTAVPTPALYATRADQKRIENYFLAHDWYYERRKNRYKNQGKPARQRITMNMLAQTMISLLLTRPDEARARPSTILGRAEGYESVFPEHLDPEAYFRGVLLLREVEDYLRTPEAKAITDEFTNARYYVLTAYAMLALRAQRASGLQLAHNFHRIRVPADRALLGQALKLFVRTARTFEKDYPDLSRDAMVKGSEFRDRYLASVGRAARRLGTSAAKTAKASAKTAKPRKVTAKKSPARASSAKQSRRS